MVDKIKARAAKFAALFYLAICAKRNLLLFSPKPTQHTTSALLKSRFFAGTYCKTQCFPAFSLPFNRLFLCTLFWLCAKAAYRLPFWGAWPPGKPGKIQLRTFLPIKYKRVACRIAFSPRVAATARLWRFVFVRWRPLFAAAAGIERECPFCRTACPAVLAAFFFDKQGKAACKYFFPAAYPPIQTCAS